MKLDPQNVGHYRRTTIGSILAVIVGGALVESALCENLADPSESRRLGKVVNQEKAAKWQRSSAEIRKKYDAPWKLSDWDDGVLQEVLVALSRDLIWIGQPVRELEAAFGKDSLQWLDKEDEGLVLIRLGRQRRHLDDKERRQVDRIAPGGDVQWFLFVYVDKRTEEISDLLLRYGSFNGFNLRGFLTTKQHILGHDKDALETQEPSNQDKMK